MQGVLNLFLICSDECFIGLTNCCKCYWCFPKYYVPLCTSNLPMLQVLRAIQSEHTVSCRAIMTCLSNDSCCPSKVKQQATMCSHVLACLMSAKTGVPSVSERFHDGASKPHDSTSGQRHEPRHWCLLKVNSHGITLRTVGRVLPLCLQYVHDICTQ